MTTQGVRRQNYYGFLEDNEEYKLDRFTATLEHEFTPDISITNTFRVSSYWHDRFVTVMPAGNVGNLSAACADLSPSCQINMGVGRTVPGWGTSTKGMDATTLQNQTTLNASFDTGSLSHQAMIGLDISREDLTHRAFNVAGTGPDLDLHNPSLISHGKIRTWNYDAVHEVDTVGVTAYDRVSLGNGFYAIGNARVERVSVGSRRTSDGATASYDDTLFSWLASLEYKPSENHTYYVTASRTLLPPTPTSGYTDLVDGSVVNPQETNTYEIGGKWSLLDERLGLGASFFFTELTDQITEDEFGNQLVNEDTRHIKGVELSAAGKLTDQLTVTAGYAWLHGRIKNGANEGYAVGLMPEHSGFVWADYQVNEKFRVGAGINFMSYRYTSDYDPTTMAGGRLPGHITVDASANYQFNDHFGIQFNAINIFNEQTFEKSHGARHMVPGQGRTFLLTAKTSF